MLADLTNADWIHVCETIDSARFEDDSDSEIPCETIMTSIGYIDVSAGVDGDASVSGFGEYIDESEFPGLRCPDCGAALWITAATLASCKCPDCRWTNE